MNKIAIEGFEDKKPDPKDRFVLRVKIILLTLSFLLCIYLFFAVGMIGSNSFALYTVGQMKLAMLGLLILIVPYVYLLYRIKPLIKPESNKLFINLAKVYGALLVTFIVFI